MKSSEVKHVGWRISGESYVSCYDDATGSIDITPTDLGCVDITREMILKCINDGSFGAKSINSAYVLISALFQITLATKNLGRYESNTCAVYYDCFEIIIAPDEHHLVKRGL